MLQRIVVTAAACPCFAVTLAVDDELADFARCLKRSGATYYGTWCCPYCERHTAMFERAGKKLPYVECSAPGSRDKLKRCHYIGGFPTWVF